MAVIERTFRSFLRTNQTTLGDTMLASVFYVLAEIRAQKSEVKLGPKDPVALVVVSSHLERVWHVQMAEGDLKACQSVEEFRYNVTTPDEDELIVEVEL